MAVFALMLAAALAAAPQDGVVATAPATTVDLTATARPLAPSMAGATQEAVPHGLSTDEQIDRWIATRSTADQLWSEAADGPSDDRKMHGQVSFGVGTGGYRDYGVAMSLPLGETGRLDLSYRQVENGYGYGGYGYARGYEPLYHDSSGYGFSSRAGLAAFEARAEHARRDPQAAPNRADAD
jgi:hypothetical protein